MAIQMRNPELGEKIIRNNVVKNAEKAELFKIDFQKKKKERNLYDKLLKKMMEMNVHFFCNALKTYVIIFNQILISNVYYQLLIVIFYNIVQHSIHNI